MEKTLIGKNGYLFLKNDTCKEIEVHTNNLYLVSQDFYKRYETIKDKILFILFPNKSLIYSQFLPSGEELKYRPGFEMYKKYFKNNLLDGYISLRDTEDTYFKTDTHINNNGALIIYNEFISKVNDVFNLNIAKKSLTLTKNLVDNLSDLQLGIGDLTWERNLGTQLLESKTDTYYKINEAEQLYNSYIFSEKSRIRLYLLDDNNMFQDKTHDNIDKLMDWNIISKYILYTRNDLASHSVVIFYDSFLCSTLQLYMDLFYDVYFIKSIYRDDIVKVLKPDYIFEFRAERFLF